MSKIILFMQENRGKIAHYGMMAVMAVMMIGCVSNVIPMAFAADAKVVSVFETVFRVLRLITTVLGTFFVILGIIKFATAHANDNGPDQQKSIMQMASGLALILLAAFILTSSMANTFAGWVATD